MPGGKLPWGGEARGARGCGAGGLRAGAGEGVVRRCRWRGELEGFARRYRDTAARIALPAELRDTKIASLC